MCWTPDSQMLLVALHSADWMTHEGFAFDSEQGTLAPCSFLEFTHHAEFHGAPESFADYNWFSEYIQRLNQVTPADVQRCALTYLRPQNRVLGVYMPEDGHQEGMEEPNGI